MRIRRTRHVAAIATLALVAGGCGKKGPPLPPFVRIPAAIEKLDAARLGNDIYVTRTVPSANIDSSMPVDIARIEDSGRDPSRVTPAHRAAGGDGAARSHRFNSGAARKSSQHSRCAHHG